MVLESGLKAILLQWHILYLYWYLVNTPQALSAFSSELILEGLSPHKSLNCAILVTITK